MGGIPDPCGGCGDPACSCCIGNSAQIEVLSGNGSAGTCFTLGIATGVVAGLVCDEAVVDPTTLADGDLVLICEAGVLTTRPYQDACSEFNALAPAVGPAVPGDEVVIFDGVDCVRKTITPSDCPPSDAPLDLGTCDIDDLAEVWCGVVGEVGTRLVTYPRKVSVVEDETEAGWVIPLAFLAEDTPTTAATSALMTLTNPSCLDDMNVILHGAPGLITYSADVMGAKFRITIEESVDGGAFVGIHTMWFDYRGQNDVLNFDDSKALPSWNRSYTVLAGASMTYQWRFVIEQTEAPVNAAVENFSSRVIMLGVSV